MLVTGRSILSMTFVPSYPTTRLSARQWLPAPGLPVSTRSCPEKAAKTPGRACVERRRPQRVTTLRVKSLVPTLGRSLVHLRRAGRARGRSSDRRADLYAAALVLHNTV